MINNAASVFAPRTSNRARMRMGKAALVFRFIITTVGVNKNCTLVFVNFSAQDASILKISVPIIKRRFYDSNTPPTYLLIC